MAIIIIGIYFSEAYSLRALYPNHVHEESGLTYANPGKQQQLPHLSTRLTPDCIERGNRLAQEFDDSFSNDTLCAEHSSNTPSSRFGSGKPST
ncbi:hypothetical protein [Pseudomonas sp. R5(2019)]|uniref:hypothetical protein n=1 Tax=Pseudomonas sp. R5(2019) TaxID=2697566 RepID=UPI001411E81A|nr:hypothetical protein [Pseudomonas sp. R5(2019)]NBA94284.1 hypothetical protein [Pseudomonas sp. R5(2019)]